MFSNYYCIFLSVILKSLVLFIFLINSRIFHGFRKVRNQKPADNSASSESESSDNSSGKRGLKIKLKSQP